MQNILLKGASNSEECLPNLDSKATKDFDSSRCRSASPNLIHLIADDAMNEAKSRTSKGSPSAPTSKIPILQRKTPSMVRLESYRSYLDRKTEALWRCVCDNDDTSGESSDPSEAGRMRGLSEGNGFEFIDLDEVSSTSSEVNRAADGDEGDIFRMDP